MKSKNSGYLIDPAFGEWLLTPDALLNHGDQSIDDGFFYWLGNIATDADKERLFAAQAMYRTIESAMVAMMAERLGD